MANQDEIMSHAALFPPPPPFWKNFTTENLTNLRQLKEAAGIKSTAESSKQSELEATQLLQLPSELRALVPPRPPTEGKFSVFGEVHNINEASPAFEEDEGYERLYPSIEADAIFSGSDGTIDRAKSLKQLAHSLIVKFVELLGVLSVDPEQWKDRIHQIHLMIVNMHQLINEYRPHQARESLITMMEDQLEKKRAEVEGIKRMGEKINRTLVNLGHEGLESASKRDFRLLTPPSLDDKRRAMQRNIWNVLAEELDD
ncbi:MED7-domain-containing protein [Pseudovirgaria hyperparasitica]|uniref:Mediator of RNA polymerase II transcription subunit 7 n=1 Tax=Pseudovirgaria hyperparasitica TaxID=470096 RepID=A0A6A6WFD7_9PEZI|nr:MED7-domain-containing protein [Pseudovirgaria hyperparasitica]KAF2760297.1 MED7-domain-containing protein [Pseudovirgaria hyperparasitica]